MVFSLPERTQLFEKKVQQLLQSDTSIPPSDAFNYALQLMNSFNEVGVIAAKNFIAWLPAGEEKKLPSVEKLLENFRTPHESKALDFLVPFALNVHLRRNPENTFIAAKVAENLTSPDHLLALKSFIALEGVVFPDAVRRYTDALKIADTLQFNFNKSSTVDRSTLAILGLRTLLDEIPPEDRKELFREIKREKKDICKQLAQLTPEKRTLEGKFLTLGDVLISIVIPTSPADWSAATIQKFYTETVSSFGEDDADNEASQASALTFIQKLVLPELFKIEAGVEETTVEEETSGEEETDSGKVDAATDKSTHQKQQLSLNEEFLNSENSFAVRFAAARSTKVIFGTKYPQIFDLLQSEDVDEVVIAIAALWAKTGIQDAEDTIEGLAKLKNLKKAELGCLLVGSGAVSALSKSDVDIKGLMARKSERERRILSYAYEAGVGLSDDPSELLLYYRQFKKFPWSDIEEFKGIAPISWFTLRPSLEAARETEKTLPALPKLNHAIRRGDVRLREDVTSAYSALAGFFLTTVVAPITITTAVIVTNSLWEYSPIIGVSAGIGTFAVCFIGVGFSAVGVASKVGNWSRKRIK